MKFIIFWNFWNICSPCENILSCKLSKTSSKWYHYYQVLMRLLHDFKRIIFFKQVATLLKKYLTFQNFFSLHCSATFSYNFVYTKFQQVATFISFTFTVWLTKQTYQSKTKKLPKFLCASTICKKSGIWFTGQIGVAN